MTQAPTRARLMPGTLIGYCLLVASSVTHAAGFAIIEQSVSGLGNAFAGTAASAEDASTVYFNPAGMTFLSKREALLGLHIIKPSAKFTDSGSTVPSGGNGGDGGVTALVPNFYYVMNLDADTKFGLGINAPFGLSTQYDKDWLGRYQAIESSMRTVNINPSLAFKVGNAISIGLGFNVQYIQAKLTSALDLSSVGSSEDGFSDISGHGWGMGYNLGMIYSPSADTRVGLAYRSKINQSLGGTADFTLPAAAVSAYPPLAYRFADTDASVNVTLPDTMALSVYQRLNNQWAMLADITRTGWSSFDKLTVEFDNPYNPPSTESNQWNDSNRYSLGVNFNPEGNWTYRAGTAYDQTPIPNAEMRTARIPDADRIWLAIGAGYQRSKDFRLEIAYAHIFVKAADINRTGLSGDVLTGRFDNKIDILSAQASWQF